MNMNTEPVVVTHDMIEKIDSYGLVKYLSFETTKYEIDVEKCIDLGNGAYLYIHDKDKNDVLVYIHDRLYAPVGKKAEYYGVVVSNRPLVLDITGEHDEEGEEHTGDEGWGGEDI